MKRNLAVFAALTLVLMSVVASIGLRTHSPILSGTSRHDVHATEVPSTVGEKGSCVSNLDSISDSEYYYIPSRGINFFSGLYDYGYEEVFVTLQYDSCAHNVRVVNQSRFRNVQGAAPSGAFINAKLALWVSGDMMATGSLTGGVSANYYGPWYSIYSGGNTSGSLANTDGIGCIANYGTPVFTCTSKTYFSASTAFTSSYNSAGGAVRG